MSVLQKIRREILKPLSGLCVKSASVNYFDLLEIENICAMKIDVEGFELEVLRGIKNTLVKYRPFVFCEFWHLPEKSDPAYDEKRRRGDSIYRLLSDIDYAIIGFLKKDNELVDIKAAEDFNNSQGSDYVLIHNSERGIFIDALEAGR